MHPTGATNAQGVSSLRTVCVSALLSYLPSMMCMDEWRAITKSHKKQLCEITGWGMAGFFQLDFYGSI